MRPLIPVACGVLQRADGTVLLAQRPPGKIAPLKWEFPGGKIEAGELPRQALDRELQEELGIAIRDARPLIRFTHAYSDRTVVLDTWLVTAWDGEPEGREAQRFEWIRAHDAAAFALLPTVLPILAALGLPSDYVFTRPDSDERTLCEELAHLPPGCLLRLRLPELDDRAYAALAAPVTASAHARGLRVIGDRGEALSRQLGLDGVHVRERDLPAATTVARDERFLRIASCHSAETLALAATAGFDAAVLGPALPTPSHPGQPGLGWIAFGNLVRTTNLPVYAIGGVGPQDHATAWAQYAQGVAGISAYWRRGGSGGTGSASSSPSASTAGIE